MVFFEPHSKNKKQNTATETCFGEWLVTSIIFCFWEDKIVQNDSEGTVEKNSEDIEENANIEDDEPVPNVKHAFSWSSDRAFVGIDRYETYVDGKQSSIVLGDGTIPHKLDTANNKVPFFLNF